MIRLMFASFITLTMFPSNILCSSSLLGRETFGFVRGRAPSIVHSLPLNLSRNMRFHGDSLKSKSVTISHPCIDGVFQYGFAEPSILSDFLNAALDLNGDKRIKDIEYFPRDMPSSDPTSHFGYHFTVDVRCLTRNGQHFLVEMQNDFRDDYHLKALIEHARMISRLDLAQNNIDKPPHPSASIDRKKKFWSGVQGVYSIVITNKAFHQKRKKDSYDKEPIMEPLLVNPYELRHVHDTDRHYGDIPNQIVLLMLANLKKNEKEISTPIERWAYLFQDAALGHGSVKIPDEKEIANPDMIAGPDKAIRDFIDRVDVKNIPFEVRDHSLRQVKYYNDCILDIELKAIEKGREEEKIRSAKVFISKKMNDDFIVEVTGLPIDQVQKLRKTK